MKPTVEELKARHAIACEFRQPVDQDAIAQALHEWVAALHTEPIPVAFLTTWDEVIQAARDARAAWDAWDAWDARDARAARAARAARDARDARAARDARDAWDAWAARVIQAAWAARVAWDAWDAWVAWAAWAARVAWDVSHCSIIAIGARANGDDDLYTQWFPLFKVFEAGAWLLWITADHIAVATLPTVHTIDQRLHRTDGPAFAWGADVRDYYWHGVQVTEQIILHPETITVDQIEQEVNTEVRRVMIERYGPERYILDSGAEEISRDSYGILYRKDIPDDEPLVMVKVTNSTPEPTGESKEYWLRVPPTIQTAHEAVAWTFDMNTNDYHPKFES